MRAIVAGTGPPDLTDVVLGRALSEAASSARPLLALTAWADPMWFGDPTGMALSPAALSYEENAAAAQQRVTQALDKALSEYGESGPEVPASAEQRNGNAGQVLVEASEQARLVVVGGRRHGAVAGALLGSTSSYVLHHAHCPVMVVHATATPGRFAQVVVGVDAAASSRSTLRWAIDAARRYDCPLLVLHALAELPEPTSRHPDAEAQALTWLNGEIAEASIDLGAAHVHSEVVEGPPSRVLLGRSGAPDLLVVGSRGRGGFTELLLGSVASQVTGHALGTTVVVPTGAEHLD